MKLTTIVAACFAIAAPQAFAQAKNFEGFSLGANVQSNRSTAYDVTAATSDSGITADLGLQLGYTWALGDRFVLGLGGTIGTGTKNKAGTLGTSDMTFKNTNSLDFTPGFAISDSVVLYGKISSFTTTMVATTAAGTEVTESLGGIGYGLGVRAMVTKNWFLQGAYDVNRTAEKASSSMGTTVSGTTNVLSLGGGYKF